MPTVARGCIDNNSVSIDRKYVARALGFSQPMKLPMMQYQIVMMRWRLRQP